MSWWRRFFLLGSSGYSAASVDWLAVEGSWRLLESQQALKDQANRKQVLTGADSLIDSILKQGGASGLTMGERLKTLGQKMPKDAYQKLWRAHIKRNEIVHESGSFMADWEADQHFQSYKQAISALRAIR